MLPWCHAAACRLGVFRSRSPAPRPGGRNLSRFPSRPRPAVTFSWRNGRGVFTRAARPAACTGPAPHHRPHRPSRSCWRVPRQAYHSCALRSFSSLREAGLRKARGPLACAASPLALLVQQRTSQGRWQAGGRPPAGTLGRRSPSLRGAPGCEGAQHASRNDDGLSAPKLYSGGRGVSAADHEADRACRGAGRAGQPACALCQRRRQAARGLGERRRRQWRRGRGLGGARAGAP